MDFSAVLKKTSNGFYYLDIPQSLVNGLYKILNDEAEETPYKQKSYGGVGAHVSVISDEELKDKDIVIEEVGEFFDFTIIGAKKVNPAGWDEMSQVYFVQIKSPQIKEMRAKYGLPKTYKGMGHEFHITFALKRK